MKCRVYNHLVTSKVSWELGIDDIYKLHISFMKDLEAICNKYLKKWLRIRRTRGDQDTLPNKCTLNPSLLLE